MGLLLGRDIYIYLLIGDGYIKSSAARILLL